MKVRTFRNKLALNTSISIGCFVFIFILSAILSLVSYKGGRDTLYVRYQAQMTSILDLAESYVDNEDLSNCVKTNVPSEKYNETQHAFDTFVTYYSDLHYLYILRVTDEGDDVPIRAVISANTFEEIENEPDEVLTLGDGEAIHVLFGLC